MTNVIGVRFRRAGKVYFFSPGKLEIRRGDNVIVETARGVEFGHVVGRPEKSGGGKDHAAPQNPLSGSPTRTTTGGRRRTGRGRRRPLPSARRRSASTAWR